MIQLNHLRRRYAQFDDEYLLELASEADTLTPEALRILQDEIASRKLEKRDQEVMAGQADDLAIQHTELIAPELPPTAHDVVHPVRPEGTLLRAFKKTLVLSKLATAAIYIVLALCTMREICVGPNEHEANLLTDLNKYKSWQLASLSAAITLTTWAFLAFRLVKSSGRPISLDGIAFICISYTMTLSLLAYSDFITHSKNHESKSHIEEVLYKEYNEKVEGEFEARFHIKGRLYVAGVNMAILWWLLIARLLQVKFVKSRDLPGSVLGFLLLRSFHFDKLRSNDSLNLISSFLFTLNAGLRWIPFLGEMFLDLTYDFRYAWTYESLLRSGLEGHRGSPMAASLYNPIWKGLPPVSGTFIRVERSEDWRSVVKISLRCSQSVIVLPGESPGLLEELRFIRYGDLPAGRVLLLIPEDTPEVLLMTFAEILRGLECDLSGVMLASGELYVFNSDWAVRPIAQGLEAYRDAVLEIQAWSIFGDQPGTAWCEFDDCQVRSTPAGRCPSCGLVVDLNRNSAVVPPDRGPGFLRPAFPFPEWEPLPWMDALYNDAREAVPEI